MAKSKKSDSEKAVKDKASKALKAEKTTKEKKGGKKDKAAEKAAKPVAAPKAAKKPAANPAKPKKAALPVTPAVVFTTEEISLRAYYIAERRQAMGWPGDSTSDWVEAERQLKAEAARKARL